MKNLFILFMLLLTSHINATRYEPLTDREIEKLEWKAYNKSVPYRLVSLTSACSSIICVGLLTKIVKARRSGTLLSGYLNKRYLPYVGGAGIICLPALAYKNHIKAKEVEKYWNEWFSAGP